MIDVVIPLEAGAAEALQSRGRREAAGRYFSNLLREGRLVDVLAASIGEAKREAEANGLTDADVDAELEAWRAERRD